MREFLSYYSKHNDINEDLVRGIRLHDNMVEKIEEICVELSKSLNEYVTYLGASFDDDKNRFRELNSSASKKRDSKTGKFENMTYLNVNYTFSRLALFHFRIKFPDPRTGEVQIVKTDMPIYIPQFIDDYHYYIRGNKYSAPYQLIDAITYLGKNDSVVLKTLTRAIKLSRTQTTIKDMHGLEWKAHIFNMHTAGKSIPFMLYYFAFYGFFNSLKYFGCDKLVKLYEDCPVEPDGDVVYFRFGKYYLGVSRKEINMTSMFALRDIVATILALQKKNWDINQIRDTHWWRMILGTCVSQTRTYEQGANLLNTFITCLDARTIANIDKIVGGFPKKDSFAVLRWMFINYPMLSNKNMSLQNKRLRYTEYLVAPLVRDVQMKLYRFLKTRPKMRDLKRLLDVFKPSPSLITNAIIGKVKTKAQRLDITKYNSVVNDLVILQATKWSKSGPGSCCEKITSKRAGVQFRACDTSYLGQIDLITSSATNVGLSGVTSPFAEVDLDTLMFKIKR